MPNNRNRQDFKFTDYMKKIFLAMAAALAVFAADAKTLIVYYSYTNNVERIATELRRQTGADIIEIEPAEKGLDYAADNYAIGSAQIGAIRNAPDDASSYPAIDPVNVRLADYDCVIVAAPLWWSNMAAPMQTFLFKHGAELAGKNIGLIVSSASTGISGVEADARRLVPRGNFLAPSLWIRSSQTANAPTLLQNWLRAIDYESVASAVPALPVAHETAPFTVYSISGACLLADAESLSTLPFGLYIVNGRKTLIAK